MEPGGDTGAGVAAVGAAPGQQWKRRMMGTARSPGAAAEQPATLAGRHLPDGRRRRPARPGVRGVRGRAGQLKVSTFKRHILQVTPSPWTSLPRSATPSWRPRRRRRCAVGTLLSRTSASGGLGSRRPPRSPAGRVGRAEIGIGWRPPRRRAHLGA
jgi:hypothetical protein